MLEDRAGHLWFCSEGAGVSRYDGAHYTVFTTEDGLGHNTIGKMHQDRAGHLWFATLGGGLSRHDGEHFKTFTTADGLASNTIVDLGEDRAGHLLIATRGGVSRFDGLVFQSLSSRDGLAADSIAAVLADRQGALWIATVGGLNRYTPTSHPPQVQLRDIIADRHYPPAGKIQIPSSQELVTFAFQGRSLTTPAEHMAYIYRLQGCDTDWQPVYRGQVEYQGLPEGDYTFQVKAVDRDLNYSEMAEVQLTIEPDALVESLTAALDQSNSTGEFVGNSPALQKVQAQLEQVAPADLTVLILGETGTGKGLAARILHQLSQRRDHPFIHVTCGAIPDALIESELFGHEKGSFTGASSRRLGKVELAKRGTLFLDEIGDMPLEAQIKLLQLLEERTFERVGGNEVLNADIRVVAATNRDLHQMVQAGSFRQDLYFRLQGFEVHLPLLRQRREDIPLLALYFIGPKAAHLDKEVTGLSKAAEQALVAHAWPGNVRELQHAIERAVVLCQGSTLQVTDLMLGQPTSTPSIQDGFATLQENERRHIQAVLESTRGRISGPKGAAIILGMPESTLRTRMKKLGMK